MKHPPMRHQNAHLARGDSCLAARDRASSAARDITRDIARDTARDAPRARGRKPEPRAAAPRAPLQHPPMRHAYESDMPFSAHENSGALAGARSGLGAVTQP